MLGLLSASHQISFLLPPSSTNVEVANNHAVFSSHLMDFISRPPRSVLVSWRSTSGPGLRMTKCSTEHHRRSIRPLGLQLHTISPLFSHSWISILLLNLHYFDPYGNFHECICTLLLIYCKLWCIYFTRCRYVRTVIISKLLLYCTCTFTMSC